MVSRLSLCHRPEIQQRKRHRPLGRKAARVVAGTRGYKEYENRKKEGIRMAFSRHPLAIYRIILRFSHYPVVSPLVAAIYYILFSSPRSSTLPFSPPRRRPPSAGKLFPRPPRGSLAIEERMPSDEGREEDRKGETGGISLPGCATGVDEIQVLLG